MKNAAASFHRIERITFQNSVPSATPDSRSWRDCSLSTSSVVRVTTGMAIRANARAARRPFEWGVKQLHLLFLSAEAN